MSDIFVRSYAAQQARESAVSTQGQPITSDGNPSQSSIIAWSAEDSPNPLTNPTGMAGNPKGPANPPVFHWLEMTKILKELERHVESFHRGQISKHKALFHIFVTLLHSPGSSATNKDLAYWKWTREVDHIEWILADTLAKGTTFDVEPPANLQPIKPVIPLKRWRDSSEDKDSCGEQGGDDQPRDSDEQHRDKPTRINDSELSWYNQELTAKETENPSISENCWLLHLYGRNISSIKQKVLHAVTAPAGILPQKLKSSPWPIPQSRHHLQCTPPRLTS